MAKTPKKPTDETDIKIDAGDLADMAPESGTGPAGGTSGNGAQTAAPNGAPMLSVLTQYIKDMSFENPNAPESLRSGQPQPDVNIDISIGRRVDSDNLTEVSITLKANAAREGKTVFIAELEYGGLFAFQNATLEDIQPMIMIECPRILFPYARKILADMTQDGGYPPIMLDMPDFAGMFREELMRRAQNESVN